MPNLIAMELIVVHLLLQQSAEALLLLDFLLASCGSAAGHIFRYLVASGALSIVSVVIGSSLVGATSIADDTGSSPVYSAGSASSCGLFSSLSRTFCLGFATSFLLRCGAHLASTD